MTGFVRWLRRFWWAIVAVVAAIGGALIGILMSRKDDDPVPTVSPTAPAKPTSLVERARQETERVHLEGELERAAVRVETAEDRGQLANIEDVGKADPAEGRRQLAAWLARNL